MSSEAIVCRGLFAAGSGELFPTLIRLVTSDGASKSVLTTTVERLAPAAVAGPPARSLAMRPSPATTPGCSPRRRWCCS